MDVEAPRGLLRLFGEVEDPRVERTKLHRLADILVIALYAVICGADTWTEIELFGEAKFDGLRTFLELPHSIPSHDTFGRVFSRLNPEQFERCFLTGMQALAQASGGRLIAIDRKTILRNRVGHSAENVSRLRRLALNLLRRDKTCRARIQGKRLQACLKEDYLLRILGQRI